MYIDQAFHWATETTLGIFNREILIEVFDYPESRRFKNPKGELSSPKDQQKQEDMTTVKDEISTDRIC